MFKNREDAAAQLTRKLMAYKGDNGVVLAVPRGGVPIGYMVAKELGFPMEILLSKKIGHPLNSELAIGSVTLHGTMLNEMATGISPPYIQKESLRIINDLKEKYKYYTGNGHIIDLAHKTVIIADDGIATGSTILAAIEAVRKSDPKKIVVATPVAPPSAAKKVSEVADEFIYVMMPIDFYGVGQFYYDFSQVSDEEVIRLLKDIQKKAA